MSLENRPENDTSAKPSLKDDVLFGAQAIANELGLELRKTFYLLERGYLPATKCGATWTSTRCVGSLMEATLNSRHFTRTSDEKERVPG